MECSLHHFRVQYVFGFPNEKVLHVKWCYLKSHDSQIVPKCILHELLNFLSISSLPRVHDMSVNFEMQDK